MTTKRYQRLIARRMAGYTLPMTAAAINYVKPEPVGTPVTIVKDAKVSSFKVTRNVD